MAASITTFVHDLVQARCEGTSEHVTPASTLPPPRLTHSNQSYRVPVLRCTALAWTTACRLVGLSTPIDRFPTRPQGADGWGQDMK
jgi:hypothetical protein